MQRYGNVLLTSSNMRFLDLVMAAFKALIHDSFSSGLTAKNTRFGTCMWQMREVNIVCCLKISFIQIQPYKPVQVIEQTQFDVWPICPEPCWLFILRLHTWWKFLQSCARRTQTCSEPSINEQVRPYGSVYGQLMQQQREAETTILGNNTASLPNTVCWSRDRRPFCWCCSCVDKTLLCALCYIFVL